MQALLSTFQAAEQIGPAGFPWIDKILAILVAVFLVLGFWRGLWWQFMRLAGFAGALAAARGLSPVVEPYLTDVFGITDPRFSQGIAWICLFITGMIVAVFLGRLGNSLLKSLQLGLVNRFAGAIAGVATALVIHSAILAAFSLLAPGDWLNKELEGSYSAKLLEVLAERWPVIVDSNHSQWVGDHLLDSGTVPFKLPAPTPAVK